MYAGRRRKSSNVRVMQIFHELKAQFPTIPDHIITACIASHVTPDSRGNLHEQVLAAAAKEQYQMGRPSIQVCFYYQLNYKITVLCLFAV